MYRETKLNSRRNIEINQSEYRPVPFNYEEIKKIRKRENISSFLDSKTYLFLIFVFTVYVLFSDDFRLLVATRATDAVFFALTIVAFIFFALDILAQLYLRRKYLKSLAVWFDLASALTVLLDIGWIYVGFFNTSQSRAYADISPAAEASLTSYKALRYLTVMRYVRLLRLNGFLKFSEGIERSYFKKREKAHYYKRDKKSFNNGEFGPSKEDISEQDINRLFRDKKKFLVYPSVDFDKNMRSEISRMNEPPEPKKPEVKSTSRDFSTNNIRRVIYLILVLVVFIPLFLIESFYYDLLPPTSWLQSHHYQLTHPSLSANYTDVLNRYATQFADYEAAFVMITLYQKNPAGSFNTLAQSKSAGFTQTETEFVNGKRLCEALVLAAPEDLAALAAGDFFVLAMFDNAAVVRKNAALGLGRTFFTLVILLVSVYFFYSDAEKLLLGPFEEMMAKIKQIEQNPMKAAKDTKEEMITLEKKLEHNSWKRREQAEKERYETTVLINTLIKSGELLALGFGEAGTEIIIETLNSSRKRDNNKVICIFGFCDIRHFSEVTDELREGIMLFVNEIAEIISTIVDENTGSTNKNIGEAFLLVWKFRESEINHVFDYDADGEIRRDIKLKEYLDFNNPITSRCEVAVLSFLQCAIMVHKSPTLNRYTKDEALARRIPGFKVTMGFGLHIGWAIEGAIGSNHKIDASYLSPNVNLASRLQAASKQFGVHILVSGQIYDFLSPEIKNLLRIVDIVNLKGSKLAMRLYTYDMCLKDIPVESPLELKEKDKIALKLLQKQRLFEYRRRVQKLHSEFFNHRISGKKFFFADENIMKAHKRFNKAFYEIWNEGFKAYVAGDWAYARVNFNKTRVKIRDQEDGPSRVLLEYMEARDFKAPEDWDGVRHLYSK